MSEEQGTRVHIFGQVYHLRGQEDPEHIRRVAELVDDRMNMIADRVPTADSFRIAVLTAIHIADEYLRLKNEHERFQSDVAAKSSRLTALLEALEPPEEPSRQPESAGAVTA